MASQWLGGETPLSNKRDDEDIFGLGLSVAKTERKALKNSDKKTYYKIRENCVKGIPNKFTQLKSIDEDSPVDHFESVYSVVTRFDDLQESLRKNDMLDVFTIASEYKIDGSGPTTTATKIDLFHKIKDTELGIVKSANQYFMEYGQEYHGENCVWSGEKILNSCDSTLRDKLIESTRGWDVKHKGGPTYLKLLMGLIVATSEKSLRSLLDKIARLKLTDFDGEDVNKTVSFLRGATLILKDNNALPNDFSNLIIRIFKQTSCDDFKSFVGLLEHNVELQLTQYSSEDMLMVFEKKYTEMLGRNEWSPKSITKDQGSAFYAGSKSGVSKGFMCYNCGGLNHGVKTCPHPYDEKAVKIRRNLCTQKLNKPSSDTSKGKDKPTNKDSSSKDGQKQKGRPKSGNRPPPDPTKVPPKKGEPHQKVFSGKTLHWCGKQGCSKWTDHKTADHDSQGNGANPQGHLVEDIGDDTTSTKQTVGFLGATSLTGF